MKIYKGPLKEGWYVYSSSGCGECAAIRMECVETPDGCNSYVFSPNQARELANLLIEVANEYDEGIETGIDEDDQITLPSTI